MTEPYPVVVSRTRYGGIYEGDHWAAFLSYQLPQSDWDGGDTECMDWWIDHKDDPTVAVGPTPDEAVAALTEKLEKAREVRP